jgi:beta-glucosidase
MRLPGHIDELVTEVTAANRNTIVVIQSGTPVEMPWAKQAGAIVQAWYGGNEAGNAIADILYGDVNPSGKLPLSFPYRLQDNPAFLNSRSEGGRILYGEDIYIGYRYYDSIGLPVLFPFGFGLSYTTFELSAAAATVDTGAGQLVVTLNVQNTGPRAGAEVVQIYVSQAAPSVRRPTKELKAYKKLFLKPGEKEAVSISVSKKYATSFWDEKRNAWVSQKDTYTVQIEDGSGTGAALRATFEIGETTWWKGL